MKDLTVSSIEEAQKMFISGNMNTVPQRLIIGDISYMFFAINDNTWEDILEGKRKGVVIFTAERDRENMSRLENNQQNLHEDVYLVWGLIQGMRHLPRATFTAPKSRRLNVAVRGTSGVREGNEIDLEEDVLITSLQTLTQPIKGKVDTGADMCSLHATDISVSPGGDMVSFVTHGSRIQTRLYSNIEIKQSNGTQQRPVILLDFKINDVEYNKIACNLSDRSDMSHKLLLGKNLLEQGDFSISMDESVADDDVDDSTIDWELVDQLIEEQLESMPIMESAKLKEQDIQNLIQILSNSNVSMKEMISSIKLHMEQELTH